MVADLWALYRFDVSRLREGAHMAELCTALLGRLPYEPWSMYRAMESGGTEHLGWGELLHRVTDLVDALQVNTAVTAAAPAGKKPKKTKPIQRPKVERKQPEQLSAVNWSFFA